MNLPVRPKTFAVSSLVCAALGALLTYLSGLSFWWAFAIVVAAVVLNGIVAEVEDRMPGGFLNPRGDRKSKWMPC